MRGGETSWMNGCGIPYEELASASLYQPGQCHF